MKNKKCFYDQTECLENKNLSLYVMTNGEMKLQKCCMNCLSKLQNSIDTKDNHENFKEDAEKNKKQKTCLSCNLTLDDILKGARLGCPMCYYYFDKEIYFLINFYHKSSMHEGKFPEKNFKPILVHNILKDLSEKLKNANEYEKENILSLMQRLNSN